MIENFINHSNSIGLNKYNEEISVAITETMKTQINIAIMDEEFDLIEKRLLTDSNVRKMFNKP